MRRSFAALSVAVLVGRSGHSGPGSSFVFGGLRRQHAGDAAREGQQARLVESPPAHLRRRREAEG